jgi:DNA-binding MarR family transcriptional regulator
MPDWLSRTLPLNSSDYRRLVTNRPLYFLNSFGLPHLNSRRNALKVSKYEKSRYTLLSKVIWRSGFLIRKSTDAIKTLNAELTNFARIYQTRNRNERLAFGLSVSQTNMLFMLAESKESTMGPFAKRLGLSLSALTKIVDELENQGLVRRKLNPEDGRGTIIQLTPKGSRFFDNIQSKFLLHLESELSGYSSKEVEQISVSLQKVSTIVSKWQTLIKEKRS